MRKLLLLALLLLLSNLGQAQTTGPGFVIYVGSAPSGTCSAGAYLEQVIGLGTVYTCQSGTWTQISGGGGGTGTVTSIATTSPITGGTITTTGTIACATCAIGPGVSTANHLAKFSGTDGVTLADGGAIPTGTVTSVATTSPLGGGTITGTGTLTCATCLTATTPTNHGVLLGAASQAVGATGAGTSGQVLTSNGASADPTFQAASGGAIVQVETHTASASASLAFTTCFSSTYHNYIIKFNDIVPATNAVNMTLTFNSDSTAIYDYMTLRFNSGGTAAGGATNATAARINAADATLSNDAHYGLNGTWNLSDPNSTTSYKNLVWQAQNAGNDSIMGQATYKSTTAVTRFDVQMSSGNIASGTVTCYGVTP